MVMFIVKKEAVSGALKLKLTDLCENIGNANDCFECRPKSGSLVALAVMLKNENVSYELTFEPHMKVNSQRE
jgi:hypothetical protein